MFDPMPRHTPQNTNVFLTVDGHVDTQLQPGPGLDIPGQSAPSHIVGPQLLSTNQVIQNRDPIVLSRQDVEMPKPVAIPPTGSAHWNRKSGLPKPKRAGKPLGRKSKNPAVMTSGKVAPLSEPAKRDVVLQANHVPTLSENVIIDNSLQKAGDSGSNLNVEFANQPQQSVSPPGLSFLMLEEEHNRRCPFKINFSNLGGIFMTRDEFDLMYFLPALQANFMGVRCRTEGMKMYLDWLSYLRERTFTV